MRIAIQSQLEVGRKMFGISYETARSRRKYIFQWIFQVPVKGGRDYITPQKARTISGI